MQCLFWTFTMHCRRFFPMSSHLLMVNQVSMLHWITEWLSHSYCKDSWSRCTCTVYMFSLNTIQNLLKKRIFILRIILYICQSLFAHMNVFWILPLLQIHLQLIIEKLKFRKHSQDNQMQRKLIRTLCYTALEALLWRLMVNEIHRNRTG